MYARQPDVTVLRISEWSSTFKLIIYYAIIYIFRWVVYLAVNKTLSMLQIYKRYSEYLP